MRRSQLEIITDMLRNAKEPSKKTHIFYKANLPYKLFIKYLKILINQNLIKTVPFTYINPNRIPDRKTKHLYQSTERGLKLIELMDKMYDILEWKK